MGHPIKPVVEMIIDFIDASIYVHTCDFFQFCDFSTLLFYVYQHCFMANMSRFVF